MRISYEQLKALEEGQARTFENEMVAHAKAFSPKLCGIIGDEQVRVAVRQAIGRARSYEFTNRGPIRLYVELMFLCGSDFDTDPQFRRLRQLLNAAGDQMERAEKMHEYWLDYLKTVHGPDNVHVRKALEALQDFARKPTTMTVEDFDAGMTREMTAAFPKKVAHIGPEAMSALMEKGQADAAKNGFPQVRAATMLVAMMFAFGHGCTADPLYPWISGTLTDERIVSPAARAERLERKALTWLEHVLAPPGQDSSS